MARRSLRELLQNSAGIAATVETDVNLGALGQSWCGVAQNASNFVFLAILTGIGAGIMLNGVLHHGTNW